MVENESDQIRRLADRAAEGSRAAFSELVKKLMNRVVALTYRMTGDREAALDLTQDAFVAAWESIKSFRRDSKFETWLYRIAVNRALNYIAHRKVADTIELTEERAGATTGSADDSLTHKELRDRVIRFMQTLPEQQRVAFELRFNRQLSFDEIAEIAGRGVPTVKTNYREAIQKLRKVALEEGWRS
jgi:RNA polymerase sigma-70 factor (ECF subfamily)